MAAPSRAERLRLTEGSSSVPPTTSGTPTTSPPAPRVTSTRTRPDKALDGSTVTSPVAASTPELATRFVSSIRCPRVRT
ncbi:hypothetical protein D9M68_925530 [compost metagenome]